MGLILSYSIQQVRVLLHSTCLKSLFSAIMRDTATGSGKLEHIDGALYKGEFLEDRVY